MKKYLLIMLFCLTAFGVKSQDTLSIQSESVICGDTFYLVIRAAHITDLASTTLYVSYDSTQFATDNLYWGSVGDPYYKQFLINPMMDGAGSFASVNTFTKNGNKIIGIGWYCMLSGFAINDDWLFKVRFRNLCNPPANSPIAFSFNNNLTYGPCEISNLAGNTIPCVYQAGYITQIVVPFTGDTTLIPSIVQQDTLVCAGFPTSLNVQDSLDPAWTFLWSTGETTSSIEVSPLQTTTYTLTSQKGSTTLVDSITLSVNGSSVSGQVTYDNPPLNTPISGATVILKSALGVALDSTYSDVNGMYRFCGLASGSYIVTATTVSLPGSVNSADALLSMKHFTEIINLEGLKQMAADVNVSGNINSVDAQLIAKKFVGVIPSFLSGDWFFEAPSFTITGPSAIIVNFKGICYGDLNGSYTPPPCFIQQCGDTLFDCRDGQLYPTVLIGNQCWLARNLNVGVMLNQSSQTQSNNTIIEKYCVNDNPANCITYGGMYRWDEMMQYISISGSQGICPAGWHIPTKGDWCELLQFQDTTVNCNILGLTGNTVSSGLRESGTQHWAGLNIGATNQSGFTALGSGDCQLNILENLPSYISNFWSSTQQGNSAWRIGLYSNMDKVDLGNTTKTAAYSVRCMKD